MKAENQAHDRSTQVRGDIVLASASPRRSDLLTRENVRFEIIPSDLPEHIDPAETPAELAVRLAGEKARAVAGRLTSSDRRWVLGADTIVVLDREVLGKPADASEAIEMLQRLTGNAHTVITGVAFARRAEAHSFHVESRVHMRRAERPEIEAYVETGEPLDKAGSYALQGEGRRFVDRVEGSESNVIGLPLEETLELLSRLTHGA